MREIEVTPLEDAVGKLFFHLFKQAENDGYEEALNSVESVTDMLIDFNIDLCHKINNQIMKD